MTQVTAFETAMSLIASLRPNASFSHDAVHTVLAAGLAVVFHVQRDVSIAIGKSTLYPELFDLSEQASVFDSPFTLRLLEPGVKAAGVNLQYSAHRRHGILLES